VALRLIQVHLTVIGKFTNGSARLGRAGRFRISTVADVDGVEVAAGDDAAARCTHDPVEVEPVQ
jgi:hydroxymethylglutaryl-CoA reductase